MIFKGITQKLVVREGKITKVIRRHDIEKRKVPFNFSLLYIAPDKSMATIIVMDLTVSEKSRNSFVVSSCIDNSSTTIVNCGYADVIPIPMNALIKTIYHPYHFSLAINAPLSVITYLISTRMQILTKYI